MDCVTPLLITYRLLNSGPSTPKASFANHANGQASASRCTLYLIKTSEMTWMNTLAAHHVDDMTPYTQSLFHCSSRGSTDDHNLPITIELPQHMPPMISPKLGLPLDNSLDTMAHGVSACRSRRFTRVLGTAIATWWVNFTGVDEA